MWESFDRLLDLLATEGVGAARRWLGEAAGKARGDAVLGALQRILDREAAALEGWKPALEPAFALQQIRNRAVACGFAALAAEAERRLEALGQPWLEDLLAPVSENPALVRTLPGGTGRRQPPLTADGKATINRGPGQVEIRDLATGDLVAAHPVGKGALVAGPGGWMLNETGDRHVYQLRNVPTGKVVANLPRPEVKHFRFSHDYRLFGFGTDRSTGFDGEYFSSFEAEIWDIDRRGPVWTIKGDDERSGGLTALAISPDKRHAAVIGCSTLYLRRLADDTTVGTWPSASVHADDLAFTPDGCHLVMNDRTAFRVVDTATGALRSIAIAEGGAGVMALSPDGSVVAATGMGRLRLWSLADGRQLWEQKIPDQFNQPVWFLPPAGLLAVAVGGGRLALFDLAAEGACRCTFDAHGGSVDSLAVSPEARFLVTSAHASVKVWNLAALTATAPAAPATWRAFRVEVTPDGRRAVLSTKTGVQVVGLDRSPPAVLWQAPDIPRLGGVAMSPDGAWVLACSSDGTVRRYPVEGGEPAVREGFGWRLGSLPWSPCGTWLVAVLDLNRFLEIWLADPGPGIVAAGEPWRVEVPGRLRDFAFSLDGKHLAVLDDMNVRVLVPSERRLAADFPCRADRLALRQDGFLLTARAHHRVAQLWNWTTGQAVADGRAEGYNGAALSPDGRWAVTGSGPLAVEEARSGSAEDAPSLRPRPTSDIVSVGAIDGKVTDAMERQRAGVVFLPDGEHAVTVLGEAGLGLWHLPSCRLVARFGGFRPFSCVAVSRDGRTVAATDAQGQAWFLRLRGPFPAAG